MKKTSNITFDWHYLTGKIPFRMTNDYLFRALMQENNNVLTAITASLLGWKKADITEATIENPIMLGATLEQKDFILDVRVLINNKITMNLEMQVVDESNWPERSLVYLCRIFDKINQGERYQDMRPAHHIGITSFKLFPENPEFYATYKLMNQKNFQKYTDKFALSVLCLPYLNKATEEDKASCLDEWALMFAATKWEDLRMLAQKNPDIDNAITTMFKLSNDNIIKEQMQAREDYYTMQRSLSKLIDDQQKEIEDQQKEIADLKKQLAEAQKS